MIHFLTLMILVNPFGIFDKLMRAGGRFVFTLLKVLSEWFDDCVWLTHRSILSTIGPLSTDWLFDVFTGQCLDLLRGPPQWLVLVRCIHRSMLSSIGPWSIGCWLNRSSIYLSIDLLIDWSTDWLADQCLLVSHGGTVSTWLILPVVICLSQRLSHACLSISFYTAKLRMAH